MVLSWVSFLSTSDSEKAYDTCSYCKQNVLVQINP